MTFIVVGSILKLVSQGITKDQKDARSKINGIRRRVCSAHTQLLPLKVMAVLDSTDCDYCKGRIPK